MKFTGERFIDQTNGYSISIEHNHRYNILTDYVSNKIILDVACGSGYGTYKLSENASKAYGVDISHETIAYAKKKYINKNLTFIRASATELPFEDNTFDIIISYETIEHVDQNTQTLILNEISRVLKKDGVLVISTPNKYLYTDLPNRKNKYHIHEFYFNEFDKFLKTKFNYIDYSFQKLNISSSILSKDAKTTSIYNNLNDGLYYIAFCSNEKHINTSQFNSVMNNLELVNPYVDLNYILDSLSVIKAKLYYKSDFEDFTEEKSLSSKYDFVNDFLNVTFDLTNLNNIDELRFDPIESEFVVIEKIGCKVFYRNNKSEQISKSKFLINGENIDGKFVYNTIDPYIKLNIQDYTISKITKISFMFKMNISNKTEKIVELEKKINILMTQKNKVIDNIHDITKIKELEEDRVQYINKIDELENTRYINIEKIEELEQSRIQYINKIDELENTRYINIEKIDELEQSRIQYIKKIEELENAVHMNNNKILELENIRGHNLNKIKLISQENKNLNDQLVLFKKMIHYTEKGDLDNE